MSTDTASAASDFCYYGESSCQHEGCQNKAYWMVDAVQPPLLLCGVHSKHVGYERTPLPRMPPGMKKKQDEARETAHIQSVREAAEANKAVGNPGKVTLQRMRMMKSPAVIPGRLLVFPNFKHTQDAHIYGGIGYSTLSPKFLGPVKHGQPGLPDARNIENFHQGSKCFAEELESKGVPGPLYHENRANFYADPVPHRHKYLGSDKNNRNVPEFFVWVDKKDGQEHHLSYVESRQFYCTFYERLASAQPAYRRLQSMIDSGTNVELCGYDAHPLAEGETLEMAYLDPSKPFGHERVLYAMLVTADLEELPWHKHKTFEF
jgi:hypothetical protein